jgi:glycerol-3-phosphate dehydrogenase
MSGGDAGSVDGREFDVIIIGAGVNGAGIARDAAMRGLRTLLLDKGDLASGTTSWSTRLIHGGLRYLEHREIGLVRESLRERERLLRLAPHLVRPLPILIPIYEGDRRGRALIRLGMLAYDVLSLGKSLDTHRILSPEEALGRAPGLERGGLRGAALYYDAQVEYAERLAVENALSARNAGAHVLTYVRVERLIEEDGAVRGVEFADALGEGGGAARAPVTVNVAGPWVDQVHAGLGGSAKRMIGGTKGSHIVVGRFPGAPRDALYAEARADGRPYFIVPWNDLYLIGTTDLRYKGDLDHVGATEDEIEYLLAETNRVVPGAGLTRVSVLYTYSGVRPLPYQEDGSEGGITRRHVIHDHAPEVGGLVSITGGKLTTYRRLSEQTVDLLFGKLGRRAPRCPTGSAPLPGAAQDYDLFARAFVETCGLPRRSAERLLRVYGARAWEVVELAGDDPELRAPLGPATAAIGAEVLMAFEREQARTLSDALLRRTMVGLGPDVGLESDEAAARIACKHLGWDDARATREVARYRAYVERYHPHGLARVAS